MQFIFLALEVIMCILFFGVIHFALMRLNIHAYRLREASPGPTSIPEELLDAVYFSLVTQSTVGYGSILPQSVVAKVVTSVQILTTLLFVIRWATLPDADVMHDMPIC